MIFVKDDFLSEPFELKRYLKDKKRNWYSDNSFLGLEKDVMKFQKRLKIKF